MEVGSAVMSILASGGPIAQAERVGSLLSPSMGLIRKSGAGSTSGSQRADLSSWPGHTESRLGMNWRKSHGQPSGDKSFAEASEIFLRLLSGETIDSTMIRETVLLPAPASAAMKHWERVGETAMKMMGTREMPDSIQIPRRYGFESIATIPKDWRRDLLN